MTINTNPQIEPESSQNLLILHLSKAFILLLTQDDTHETPGESEALYRSYCEIVALIEQKD